ncbi:MAG: hypothetical protein D6683_14345, partial [Actinomyces sp.]
PVSAPTGAVAAPAPAAPGTGTVPRPTWRDRRAARKLRARRVRRLVRHVEPWSVLKISLVFYFCLWGILLIAGVLLWSVAVSSGMIDNLESFIRELFALKSFEFDADLIFRAAAMGGLILVVAASGFTVLMAVLFNLISDVTGGIRITVVEEETARPRPRRTRVRAGAAVPPWTAGGVPVDPRLAGAAPPGAVGVAPVPTGPVGPPPAVPAAADEEALWAGSEGVASEPDPAPGAGASEVASAPTDR